MATKKKEEVEDAVLVIDRNDIMTAAESITNKLPEIPDKFYLVDEKTGEEKEYSLEVVSEISARADKLIKKVTPKTYSDKALISELEAVKQELVKQRTQPDTKRGELMKPVNAWIKNFKASVDRVGNAALEKQKEVEKKLQEVEDYEAELERQREAERLKRAESRREELRGLGGLYDVDNSTFTFGHSPGTTVGVLQINEYDDSTWAQEIAILKEAYDGHLAKIKAQEEAKEKELAKAREQVDAAKIKMIKLRRKELDLEGFVFDEGLQSFTKNGVTLHVLAVEGYSDEDWDEAIDRSNKPVEELSPESNINTPLDDVEAVYPPIEDAPVVPIVPVAPFQPTDDMVQQVVNSMVQENQDRVDELDGTVRKEIVFTDENPYFDIVFKSNFIRVFPTEKDDEATRDLITDKIMGTNRENGLGLTVMVVKL